MQVIEQIQAQEIKKGITHETSERTFRLLRKILDLAVNKGYIEHNPTRDIIFNDTFKTSSNNHYKAITEPSKLKRAIRCNAGLSGLILHQAGINIWRAYLFA